jgi:2-polyprenyl-6-methoxyphenol hydroxylase-like FAD-dependent oxidoreductase
MRPDIAIIGGGLAGLVAAITCAEAGALVKLREASRRLGGRARTAGGPFKANLGPHALYNDGAAWEWLRRRDLLPDTDPSLAPAGHELFQAQIGMRPGESADDACARLERLADTALADWRERVIWHRRQVMDACTGALDLPGAMSRERAPEEAIRLVERVRALCDTDGRRSRRHGRCSASPAARARSSTSTSQRHWPSAIPSSGRSSYTASAGSRRPRPRRRSARRRPRPFPKPACTTCTGI